MSASTHRRARLLATDQAKGVVRDALKALALRYRLTLRAWVVLDNHYHLLLRSGHARDIPAFFRQLHAGTARQLNMLDETPGRQVWHNYWDTGMRSETDVWIHFNYVHQNPVKHGYVQRLEEWSFSSYLYYLRTKGREWLADCWTRYPVVDFMANDDFDRHGTPST